MNAEFWKQWAWIGVAFSALAGAALIAWLWRRRPWRGPRPRYPVVLVHGVLGFAEISIGTLKQNYFRGIAEHLERLGVTVYKPRLPPLSSIAQRAGALADALHQLPNKRVNIVAHSMGGLDARYAINRLGCNRCVASLTTIGTPHRGTPFANLGSALLGERFGIGRLLSAVGLGMEAVHDLTTARIEKFNKEIRNVRGVRYASVIATVNRGQNKVHPLLTPCHLYLNHQDKPNDGLIPAESQAWGTVLDQIEADHWAQIGWSSGFDAPAFFERLLTKLRARGL